MISDALITHIFIKSYHLNTLKSVLEELVSIFLHRNMQWMKFESRIRDDKADRKSINQANQPYKNSGLNRLTHPIELGGASQLELTDSKLQLSL